MVRRCCSLTEIRWVCCAHWGTVRASRGRCLGETTVNRLNQPRSCGNMEHVEIVEGIISRFPSWNYASARGDWTTMSIWDLDPRLIAYPRKPHPGTRLKLIWQDSPFWLQTARRYSVWSPQSQTRPALFTRYIPCFILQPRRRAWDYMRHIIKNIIKPPEKGEQKNMKAIGSGIQSHCLLQTYCIVHNLT